MAKSKQHQRITRKLKKIGAAWAVSSNKYCSPDDPLEDQIARRKSYHIHPDASYPHVNQIQRFDSLREIEEWIKECEEWRNENL